MLAFAGNKKGSDAGRDRWMRKDGRGFMSSGLPGETVVHSREVICFPASETSGLPSDLGTSLSGETVSHLPSVPHPDHSRERSRLRCALGGVALCPSASPEQLAPLARYPRIRSGEQRLVPGQGTKYSVPLRVKKVKKCVFH